MRRFLSIVLALGLVLSFSLVTATPAQGADIDVPGDYPTIQLAIDNASFGDTIYVAAGIYGEVIDLANGVDVLGAGAGSSIIDGSGLTGPVVDALGTITTATVFDGFTIEGGYAGVGGGMYINSSTLTVSNCVFFNNDAANRGGGMFITSSSPTVIGCTFDWNKANISGGGICCWSSSSPVIANNIIINNETVDPTGLGGGGIYVLPGASPTIINNTIVNNTVVSGVTHGGGGILVQDAPLTTITNNIIAENTAPAGSGIYSYNSTLPIDHNDVWNDTLFNCSRTSGITADPVFVGGGDYHLQPTSNCIDVGDNTAANNAGLTTDYEGDPRIYPAGGTVDMGADEYYVAPPPPPSRGAVGGEVFPIDKAALLLPWLGLGAVLILAAGGLILVRRRAR